MFKKFFASFMTMTLLIGVTLPSVSFAKKVDMDIPNLEDVQDEQEILNVDLESKKEEEMLKIRKKADEFLEMNKDETIY